MTKKQIDINLSVKALMSEFNTQSKRYERINARKIEIAAEGLLFIIDPHIKNNKDSKNKVKYWVMAHFYELIIQCNHGGFTINEKET